MAMENYIYMRHKKKENYEIMEKWIEKDKENSVIIYGDFNARTAEEGGLWILEEEKEERRSKDKVVNEEDKEMISSLEENGVGMGNGTKIGSSRRDWTFLGTRGCIVIDNVIRNEAGREKVTGMRIGESIKSDYLPMEISLEWEEEKKEKERRRKEIKM